MSASNATPWSMQPTKSSQRVVIAPTTSPVVFVTTAIRRGSLSRERSQMSPLVRLATTAGSGDPKTVSKINVEQSVPAEPPAPDPPPTPLPPGPPLIEPLLLPLLPPLPPMECPCGLISFWSV